MIAPPQDFQFVPEEKPHEPLPQEPRIFLPACVSQESGEIDAENIPNQTVSQQWNHQQTNKTISVSHSNSEIGSSFSRFPPSFQPLHYQPPQPHVMGGAVFPNVQPAPIPIQSNMSRVQINYQTLSKLAGIPEMSRPQPQPQPLIIEQSYQSQIKHQTQSQPSEQHLPFIAQYQTEQPQPWPVHPQPHAMGADFPAPIPIQSKISRVQINYQTLNKLVGISEMPHQPQPQPHIQSHHQSQIRHQPQFPSPEQQLPYLTQPQTQHWPIHQPVSTEQAQNFSQPGRPQSQQRTSLFKPVPKPPISQIAPFPPKDSAQQHEAGRAMDNLVLSIEFLKQKQQNRAHKRPEDPENRVKSGHDHFSTIIKK